MIRILTSIAALLAIGTGLQAQTPKQTPKLVIGITIDQLKSDYLQLFEGAFSEEGFKKLMREGLVYQNMKYDFPNVNAASSIATIYTGSNPNYHGIVSEKIYSKSDQKEVSIFADENYMGNYSQDRVSPKALKASTITDELKTASDGRSRVYSFAPNLFQSIITSGHLGNSAYWVEDSSGKWASTTFYKDFHWVVDQENRGQNSYSIKAWGYSWTPLRESKDYEATPYGNSAYSFNQQFGSDNNTYLLYKQSPLINESTIRAAKVLIEKAELGKSVNPDFLSLTLYAGRYENTADYSAEIKDSYIRLDRDLGQLIHHVDSVVGLKNTLFFITSSGHYIPQVVDKEEEVQEGVFYPERCEALLNMYLMAIYGRDNQWVNKYYDNQIYLNRELIKQKDLPLKQIQEQAATFVSEFTGVHAAYTVSDILGGKWSPHLERYRNGIHRELAGDILVEIQPGYQINNKEKNKKEYMRANATICPVFFLGNNIVPKTISREINAKEIAPSVTHILRIRPPNASQESVLPELW